MDGREAMALSGSASYYMQRGLAGSASTGLLGPAGIRPLSNPGLTVPSNIGSPVSSGYGVDSPATISPHSVSIGQPSAGIAPMEPVRRKRGRPRKYGPDGTASLALSPLSSSAPAGSSAMVVPQQKRGRGRPPGSGKKQQLASLGEWLSGSAGMGFMPHIITIPIGEDIATKIMSFSQQGPRAVCILSANGAVSTVTLRQPATSGGTVTYEGRFEILCLSGSYLLTESGSSRSRTGGLSVSLASPDGRVIGGGVAGVLLAASPVQVIVGSFIYGGSKTQNREGTKPERSGDSDIPAAERSGSPARAPPTQNPAATMMMASGWPGSRPMDIRNAHRDIDLTRG